MTKKEGKIEREMAKIEREMAKIEREMMRETKRQNPIFQCVIQVTIN